MGKQLVDNQLDVVESLPEDYKKRYIPGWFGQSHYVEVWVEKTMAGVLKSLLVGYQVRLFLPVVGHLLHIKGTILSV